MYHYFKENNANFKLQLLVKSYLKKCTLGDWFVLYQLAKNVNKLFFWDFLVAMSLRDQPEPLQEISIQ
jgi:hypothetical protein